MNCVRSLRLCPIILSDKQCTTDILPTWLFKLCAAELSPFLSHLYSHSFVDGVVSLSYKAALSDATFKETRPGSVRRAVVSTNIESFRRVQTTQASGRQTYAILLDVVWADAIVTFCIQSSSLDRNCCTPSNGGHFAGSGSQRFRHSSILGSVGGF